MDYFGNPWMDDEYYAAPYWTLAPSAYGRALPVRNRQTQPQPRPQHRRPVVPEVPPTPPAPPASWQSPPPSRPRSKIVIPVSSSDPVDAEKTGKKGIKIDVSGVHKNQDRRLDVSAAAAAVRIQRVFRGFAVRRDVRRIAQVAAEVDEIERMITAEEGQIRNDPKERLRLTEMLMKLVLHLDSVHHGRAYRRKVVRRAIALQDLVDSLPAQTLGPMETAEPGNSLIEGNPDGVVPVEALKVSEENDSDPASGEADPQEVPRESNSNAVGEEADPDQKNKSDFIAEEPNDEKNSDAVAEEAGVPQESNSGSAKEETDTEEVPQENNLHGVVIDGVAQGNNLNNVVAQVVQQGNLNAAVEEVSAQENIAVAKEAGSKDEVSAVPFMVEEASQVQDVERTSNALGEGIEALGYTNVEHEQEEKLGDEDFVYLSVDDGIDSFPTVMKSEVKSLDAEAATERMNFTDNYLSKFQDEKVGETTIGFSPMEEEHREPTSDMAAAVLEKSPFSPMADRIVAVEPKTDEVQDEVEPLQQMVEASKSIPATLEMQEVVEKVMAENKKLQQLVGQLCESFLKQSQLATRLAERVEHLEQVVEKMQGKEKKKKKHTYASNVDKKNVV